MTLQIELPEKCCGHCAHGQEVLTNIPRPADEQRVMCRRYPPELGQYGGWHQPEMYAGEWCGEFQKRGC